MEKRFRKHPVVCEEGQSGCVIGLISMLDFRQPHLNHGLISNEKHVNQKESFVASRRRSVKALMEEEISAEKKELSSVSVHLCCINDMNKARKVCLGAQDYPVYQCSDMERPRQNSDQKFLKALEVLKMNKTLCLKLLQDGNSHSSMRNTKNVQDLQEETGCGLDNRKITYDSLLKKIKNKHRDRSRTSESHSTSSTVVVLKPEPKSMPISEDVSCNCSLNSYKPVPVTLKIDKKKKIKHPSEQIHVEFKRKDRSTEKASQMKDSNQFDIFLEAKRHMSKRLSNSVQDGAALSSQEPPRTLEKILSLPKLTSENSKTPAVAKKPKDDQSQLFQETPRRKSTNGVEKRESEEWTSPVSVLEPFFIDNLSSPSTPGSQWDNTSMRLQPLRLDYEEYSTVLSSPDLGSCFDDFDTISKYVKSVLQSRPKNWDDIFLKMYQSDKAFDQTPFFNEMEPCPVNSYWQHKLLYDCTNEAFFEVCQSQLGFSSLAWLMSSNLVDKLDLFHDEINKRVNRQFVPRPVSRTLQDVVGEDLSNDTWKWMDLGVDIEDIAIQVVEFVIVDYLIPETITEIFI